MLVSPYFYDRPTIPFPGADGAAATNAVPSITEIPATQYQQSEQTSDAPTSYSPNLVSSVETTTYDTPDNLIPVYTYNQPVPPFPAPAAAASSAMPIISEDSYSRSAESSTTNGSPGISVDLQVPSVVYQNQPFGPTIVGATNYGPNQVTDVETKTYDNPDNSIPVYTYNHPVAPIISEDSYSRPAESYTTNGSPEISVGLQVPHLHQSPVSNPNDNPATVDQIVLDYNPQNTPNVPQTSTFGANPTLIDRMYVPPKLQSLSISQPNAIPDYGKSQNYGPSLESTRPYRKQAAGGNPRSSLDTMPSNVYPTVSLDLLPPNQAAVKKPLSPFDAVADSNQQQATHIPESANKPAYKAAPSIANIPKTTNAKPTVSLSLQPPGKQQFRMTFTPMASVALPSNDSPTITEPEAEGYRYDRPHISF